MTSNVNLSQRLYKSFGAMLALLLFLVTFSIFNFRRLADVNVSNLDSYQFLVELQATQESLFNIDAGARGYTTGGDIAALQQSEKGREDFETHFGELLHRAAPYPEKQALLFRLKKHEEAWLHEHIDWLINLRKLYPNNRTAIVLNSTRKSGSRRIAMEAMRKTIGEIKDSETAHLNDSRAQQQALHSWTVLTLSAGGLFSVALTIALVTIVANNSKALDLANQRLERTNEELAGEVGERKRAEEKLSTTVTELERSNSELEQFAYVASHDLQEPLRAVAGCVQVLQRRYQGKLDERADQFIEHAVDGAHRMQTLINDLLTFSRVGTRGKFFEPVDGEKLLSDVLSSVRVSLNESGGKLTSDPLPTLIGDPGQLEQLLQNLISNALKFREGKAPTVHVGCRRETTPDGDRWVLWVQDDGPGIDPQYFDRIFIMFQRLHARTDYPGTGIGLAICKKIVERHGGKIWVVSQPEEGAAFYFSLPVVQPEAAMVGAAPGDSHVT